MTFFSRAHLDHYHTTQIPDHTKRPVALLELLGQARGVGRSDSGNNDTGLNACEALTVCKLAISALISAEDRGVSDEASTTVKDRENLGREGKEKGQQQEQMKPRLVPFLLDIDQEVYFYIWSKERRKG